MRATGRVVAQFDVTPAPPRILGLPVPVLLAAVAGGSIYALDRGASMFEAVLATVIGGALLGVGALVFRQPRPRAWLHRQFPSVRRLLGVGEPQPLAPATSALPSLDDLRRWQEFIQAYSLAAAPRERLNLVYDPEYVEIEPYLSQETRRRIEVMTGLGLTLGAVLGPNPADEIKRLIYRDLEAVRRKAFKADPYSDDDGYLQRPPRGS